MKKLVLLAFSLCFGLSLYSSNALACGPRGSACPADDCDKDRCEQYVNRTGEFAGRPVFRCLDMCASKCSRIMKDEEPSCKKEDEKKADAGDYEEAVEDTA